MHAHTDSEVVKRNDCTQLLQATPNASYQDYLYQKEIKKQVEFYICLREEIRMASGETLDMKTYEADMRHLIDNYIQADDSKIISVFGDLSLLEIITKSGIADAINSMPGGIRGSKQAVSETIENNVRSKIIKDHF